MGVSGGEEGWGLGMAVVLRGTPAPALDFHFQTLLPALFVSSLLNDLVLPLPCALQAV